MNTLKALIVLPILALVLTGCGALGDSKDESLATAPTATAIPAAVPEVATTQTTAITTDARIDAASFLNALVASGCDIDEAEYKEVIRGGGIKVTCTKSKDALDTEGLDAL